MSEKKAPVIHWFRRDLRIADNTALWSAAEPRMPVIPVYIASNWRDRHSWTGPNRQQFLCKSLESLAENLKTIGGRLIIRQGTAVSVLKQLIEETGATALHFNADPDPFGKAVEIELKKICADLGVGYHRHHDVSLHAPNEVLTQSDQPYRVFTPFSRNWLEHAKPSPLPKPKSLDTPAGVKSLPLPTVATWRLDASPAKFPAAGERAARERLKNAVHGIIQHYGTRRDFPAEEGTSRLSQDLRYGLVSIRTVFAACIKAREKTDSIGKGNIDIFIKELAWREFYFAILHHFPTVLDDEFNADWRGLPWDEPGAKFELWKDGRTGFPLVDAGMRELKATGFMHNRVRMITAMFLTKDLHLDWRLGESWFMQNLVDGEIASNNGGWQWSAGTGADAAPYFRIQNPWSQTTRYDPQGTYIRKWIPELAHVPGEKFQTPPKDGNPLAPGYPLPCLDHKTEREKTLAIFKNHRAEQR